MRALRHIADLGRLRRADDGIVFVEFVIVLPFLLLLLFAIAEIGRGLWYHHIITKGVRDGVRYLTRVPLPDPIDQNDPFVVESKRIAMTGCPQEGCNLLLVFWNDLDTIDVTVTKVPHDGEFRFPNPVRVVRMTAEVPIDLWLLNFFGLEPMVTFNISDQQRHIGD